ncbi:hypothetical protein NW754_012454 [Fusarium falciforme]|nr:hypothetical protein NW754_012454 [Fusarium falciforme]
MPDSNTPRQPNSSIPKIPDIGNQKHESPYVNERGYVDFNSGDAENPRNWSRTRRWIITSIAVILALNGNFSSSIFAASLDSVVDEFNVSEIAAALTTTLFLLGFCAGPFIFAPLSEFYGRRWIFYITFAAYMAFTFLCAFPPSFGGLLVGRFLAGTFISAPLSTTPGVLVDLWDPIERGNATAIFSLASWVGPSLGSVISGFVQLERDWRWGVYSALWLGASTMALMFLIPETHGPTILAQKSKRARRSGITGAQTEGEEDKPKLHQLYKMALTRPWILMFDLISLLCSVYTCIVFTLQFMLFSIYPIVFREMRGWNAGGFAATPDRTDLPWIVPTLAGTFLSTSLMLVYVAIINYLTDTYTDYAASVIAANTVTRSAGSAAAPLFTNQMFSALGVGGGGSLIGGVATLLALIPFVFYKYGSRIRRKSKYALVDSDQLEKVDEEADPTDYGVQPDETQHAGELSRAATGNQPEE